MTVHPNSVTQMENGVSELLNLGIEQINIAPAYGTVDWSDSKSSDFANAIIVIAKMVSQKKRIKNRIDIGPLYQNSEHINCKLKGVWGCSAGSSNIAILPNGDIAGCSSLAMISNKHSELIIGNVLLGLDQEKVDNALELVNAGESNRKKCKSCKAKNNCYGGCLAINYATTNSAYLPPAIYCKTIMNIEKGWSIIWAS